MSETKGIETVAWMVRSKTTFGFSTYLTMHGNDAEYRTEQSDEVSELIHRASADALIAELRAQLAAKDAELRAMELLDRIAKVAMIDGTVSEEYLLTWADTMKAELQRESGVPRAALDELHAFDHAELRTQSGSEHPCSTHPDAPHGFARNASHNAGRYVCDCEGWQP